MYMEWAKAAVLDIFGASRYFPIKTAIVLAEPSDCRPGAPIDWRQVWDKTATATRRVPRLQVFPDRQEPRHRGRAVYANMRGP